MSKKGYFTGRKIKLQNKTYTIGKITGWNATGIPIYETIQNGKKTGEINNRFIHKAKKEKRLGGK